MEIKKTIHLNHEELKDAISQFFMKRDIKKYRKLDLNFQRKMAM